MAVTISTYSENIPQTSVITENEVHFRLRDKSVDVIKTIVTDNANRQGYRENIQLLNGGIFYPMEYFNALCEKKQTKRLDFFNKKDSFFHGYVSSKHFQMTQDINSPSGKKVACFILEKGVLPSEALNAMKEGLSLFGCAEVCQISQYAAIEDILGSIKFNALFASDSSTPLMIGSTLPNNPISRLRVYLMKENPSHSEIKKGDLVFIQNANSYFSKHLTGHAGGYNALCIDDTIASPKFTTLGLSPNGNTHDQIQTTLIFDYNTSYTSLESMSENTKQILLRSLGEQRVSTSQELKMAQISLEEFKEQNGGKITIVCELDTKRITALANSTLEEARSLLDGYDVRRGNRISINE